MNSTLGLAAWKGLTQGEGNAKIVTMRVELQDNEAAVAVRCILGLQVVQAQAQQQMARLNAKLSELEAQIRERLPDLPKTPISEWQWDLDPIEGKGAANILGGDK